MKWFTADLHLGHKNIIDYCDRPFRTLDGQMDTDAMFAALAQNWDSVVRPGDEVYLLGDVSFDSREAIRFLRDRPGQKFLVWGNHDPKKPAARAEFKNVVVKTGDMMETTIGDNKVVMCHYPMLRWNKAHFGSFMLHGHTHGELQYPYPMRILDVGVDKEFALSGGLWHQRYFPVSEREVLDYMRGVPEVKHHYHKGEQ